MNSAAHLISGAKTFDHITPILQDLHWLPIEKHIQFKLICMAFKALNGLGPQYLSDLLKLDNPPRPLRSADRQLLCMPVTFSKKYRKSTFAYAAPMHYNAFPLTIHQSTSLDMFNSHLKTHFFRQVYDE